MAEQVSTFQIDLFTGEAVDRRTSAQKQADEERQRPRQSEMFSQREVAQFGVSARPVMPFSPGRLHLISEDPRSADDIERGLLRQAQALTVDLFSAMPIHPPEPDMVLLDPSSTIPDPNLLDADSDEETSIAPPEPPLTKYAAYLALVTAAEERAATRFSTPVSALSESITMNLAKLNARTTVLTGAEINAAIQIGDWRGRSQRNAEVAAEPRQSVEIPVLWTNTDDMVKRRPDLASQIASLRSDEVEALAALVGDTLEEFYWIQLNVVLSLYLDHDLRLTRVVQKQRN